ncbi:hypothetical protein MHU86_9203 [Fragilaria crotonensis]|nr:hypothetical protein MHU86_9203 [Fragilaria crotonensis]
MGQHSFALTVCWKDFGSDHRLDVMSVKRSERSSVLDLVQLKAPWRRPLSATHWGSAKGQHSFALTASSKDFGLDPGLEVMSVKRSDRRLVLDLVQPKARWRQPLLATHWGLAKGQHSFALTVSLKDFQLGISLEVMSVKRSERSLGHYLVQPKARSRQPLTATSWGLAMGRHSFAQTASVKDFQLGISSDVMSVKRSERHLGHDLVQPKVHSRRPLTATHWGLAMGRHSFALTASLKDFGLDPGLELMSVNRSERHLALDLVKPKAPSRRPLLATRWGLAMGQHSFALTVCLKDFGLDPHLEVMSAKR